MMFLKYFFLTTLLFPGGQAQDVDLSGVEFQSGDVIFQEADSPQCRAIQLATRSKYTHCGLVVEHGGQFCVYEALGQMTLTPVADWINRGVKSHFVLMRLRDRARILTPEVLSAMTEAGEALAERRYDHLFQWSDDLIYCSELVWKIYERGAGLILAPPRPLKDYELSDPAVREIIERRFGSDFPEDEPAVAPSDLLASPLLEMIAGN